MEPIPYVLNTQLSFQLRIDACQGVLDKLKRYDRCLLICKQISTHSSVRYVARRIHAIIAHYSRTNRSPDPVDMQGLCTLKKKKNDCYIYSGISFMVQPITTSYSISFSVNSYCAICLVAVKIGNLVLFLKPLSDSECRKVSIMVSL